MKTCVGNSSERHAFFWTRTAPHPLPFWASPAGIWSQECYPTSPSWSVAKTPGTFCEHKTRPNDLSTVAVGLFSLRPQYLIPKYTRALKAELVYFCVHMWLFGHWYPISHSCEPSQGTTRTSLRIWQSEFGCGVDASQFPPTRPLGTRDTWYRSDGEGVSCSIHGGGRLPNWGSLKPATSHRRPGPVNPFRAVFARALCDWNCRAWVRQAGLHTYPSLEIPYLTHSHTTPPYTTTIFFQIRSDIETKERISAVQSWSVKTIHWPAHSKGATIDSWEPWPFLACLDTVEDLRLSVFQRDEMHGCPFPLHVGIHGQHGKVSANLEVWEIQPAT